MTTLSCKDSRMNLILLLVSFSWKVSDAFNASQSIAEGKLKLILDLTLILSTFIDSEQKPCKKKRENKWQVSNFLLVQKIRVKC